MPPTVSLHLVRPLPEAAPAPATRAFSRALARAGAARGEVNLVLTSAREVRRLNRQFRGEDRETDVIAFDYLSDGASESGSEAGSAAGPKRHPSARQRTGLAPFGLESFLASEAGDGSGGGRSTTAAAPVAPARGRVWGDVFVSAEAALAQALERGVPPREELARLFLHGCLHLVGHRDATSEQAELMTAVQEELLAELLAEAPPSRARPRALRRPRAG